MVGGVSDLHPINVETRGPVDSRLENWPYPSEHQYGMIYDLISEGEIQGLVNGISSIYLNNVPIQNTATKAEAGGRVGSSTTTANSSNVTVPSSFISGMSTAQGSRFVNIMNAAATGSVNGNYSQGSTTITTTTNMFTSTMDDDIVAGLYATSTVKQSKVSILPRYVTIPGSMADGSDGRYLLLAYVAPNQIEIYPGLQKAVSSGTKIHVDYIGKIVSYATSTVFTVTPAVPRAVTHSPTQFSIRLSSYGTAGDSNFEGVRGDFRTGTRYQMLTATGSADGVPNASFTAAPGNKLEWTTGFNTHNFDGTDTGDSGSQSPQVINPTAAPFNLTADQAKQIDSARLIIEFPAGLSAQTDEGNEVAGICEFQIFVHYKSNSSDSSYKKVLKVGRHNPDSFVAYGAAGSLIGVGFAADTSIIRAKTQTAFVVEFTANLTDIKPFTDWYLEIKRTTPSTQKDYTQSSKYPNHSFQGMAQLKFVELMVHDKLNYPNSAYGQVVFSARDFPTVPHRAYHIRGKKIKVPSNYITREEQNYNSPLTQEASYNRHVTTGVKASSYQVWDGNFRGDDSLNGSHVNRHKVYCNNPAWVFYDILTNKEYGLGMHLEDTDIDKYSLYQIGRYCDEMVPDGKGGLEPRFTANLYIAKLTEAYKVLKDMASIFRGMIIWMDGQVTAVQDRPKEPVYTFTTGNVENGLFEYEYTGSKARANQINVTYNDPEQLFKQTVLVIDDVDNIVETGKIVKNDTLAFGCTSPGQATRWANWMLKTNLLETELVKFTTSIAGGFLRPGDIIIVQDKKLSSIEFSGRLGAGSTTTSIALDRNVVLQSGQTYELFIFFPEPGAYLQQDYATINSVVYSRGDLISTDASGAAIDTALEAANLKDDSGNDVFTYYSQEGRLEKKTITTSAGTVSTLAVSSAFSSAAPSDTVWAISNVNDLRTDAPIKYRILALEEDDSHKFSILAGKYSEEKYDEIEKKFLIPTEQYKDTPSKDDVVPAPTGVRMTMTPSSGISGQSSGNEYILNLSWNAPEPSGSYPFYKFLESYEIRHPFNPNFDGSTTSLIIPGSRTSTTFTNVQDGVYTIKVRTRNTQGQVSSWARVTQTVKPSEVTSSNFGRAGRLAFGGTASSNTTISGNGGFKFAKADFRYVAPGGSSFDQNGSMSEVAFSSMSNGDVAYAYYDHSAIGFIAAQLHADNVVVDTGGEVLGVNYWKTLGASNNGLSTLTSGTVVTTVGSNVVTGSGTVFNTDFDAGDLIKITTSNAAGTQLATAEYAEVTRIESNTILHCTSNFTKAQSGYAYKQSFKPDFATDAVVTKISKSGGNYSLVNYVIGDGSEGSDGRQTVNGIIYRTAASSSTPAVPSMTSYTFSTRAFTGGNTSAWSLSPPAITAANANNFWQADYKVTETVAGGNAGVPSYGPLSRRLDGTGNTIGKDEGDLDVDNLADSGNTKTGAVRAWAKINEDLQWTGDFKNNGSVYSQLNVTNEIGAKSQESTNRFTLDTDSTEGRFGYKIGGGATAYNNVFSSAERTKLDRLRLGQDPADAAKSILNNGITIDGSGVLTGIGTGSIVVNSAKTTWDHVRGNSSTNARPADGATIGAVAGTNLWRAGGTQVLTDNQIITSAGTSADTAKVNNVTAATVSGGAVRANAGLDSSGNVNRTVPTSFYTDTNTHPSASETRAHFSHTGPGSYNSTTGLITGVNTHPAAAEVRGHFSGTGINTSSGVITNTTYADLAALDSTAATQLAAATVQGQWNVYSSRTFVPYQKFLGTGTGATASSSPSGDTSVTVYALHTSETDRNVGVTISINSGRTSVTANMASSSYFTASGGGGASLGGNNYITITHTASGQSAVISYALIDSTEGSTVICCFTEETLVTMSDYTSKSIKDIQIGDSVKTETGVAEVTDLHPTILDDRKLYSINGAKAFVTSEHPFKTEQGWKSIDPERTKLEREELFEELNGDLQIGDKILKLNNEYEEVSSIVSIEEPSDTYLYNFTVNGSDHSYYANGYCVHNK